MLATTPAISRPSAAQDLVLIPFIEACRERFGDARARSLVAAAIRGSATDDDTECAQDIWLQFGAAENTE
jgi:hypothetical protein